MRTFIVPAAYERYVEAAVATAVSEVGQDRKSRADGRQTIPDEWINASETGTLVVMLAVPTDGLQRLDVRA